MNRINDLLDPIISNVLKNQQRHDTDYIGEDGLIRCGECGEPRQCRITVCDEERVVPCTCACDKKRIAADEERKRAEDTERRRRDTFPLESDRRETFAADDSPESIPSRAARSYAESFDPDKSDTLIMHGGTGTGKTTLAKFIANRVIDRGYTVWFTSISEIECRLWPTGDREGVYSRIRNTDLLVLDDFGFERRTEYMNDIVYSVINARYVTGKPMIITTNLEARELIKGADINTSRVLSRIDENAVPLLVEGEDRRLTKLKLTGADKLNRLLAYGTDGGR